MLDQLLASGQRQSDVGHGRGPSHQGPAPQRVEEATNRPKNCRSHCRLRYRRIWAGMIPNEAWYVALQAFGGGDKAKEGCRRRRV